MEELTMNYNKKSIEDIDVTGKRVLCRCDFNVPTKNGKITSDKRIVAAMPTIKYLVDHNAKVILCSHMGKPKGEWKPELSLQVVADRISELLGKPVIMAKDVAGEDAHAKAAALKPSARGEYEITDLNRLYLDEGTLKVEIFGRGFAWLDTGNCDSLLEASNFVATIQNRQGFRVSCIEEIAWRKGWIDADQLYRLGEQLGKTEYGTYLMELANSHR